MTDTIVTTDTTDALDYADAQLDIGMADPRESRWRGYYGHVGLTPGERVRFEVWRHERHTRAAAIRATTYAMWESTQWMR